MTKSSFIAGMEEAVARIAGLLLSVIFFIIFVTARETITLDWMDAAGALLLFWFVYELISYGLYILFSYFKKTTDSEAEAKKTQATETVEDESSAKL